MTNKSNFASELLKQNGHISSAIDADQRTHLRLLIEKEERKIGMIKILTFFLIFVTVIVVITIMGFGIQWLISFLSIHDFSAERFGIPTGDQLFPFILSCIIVFMIPIGTGFLIARTFRSRERFYNAKLESIENILEKLAKRKDNEPVP